VVARQAQVQVGGRQVERHVRAPAAQRHHLRAVEQDRVRRRGEEGPEDVLDLPSEP
jgi:hypothetical protein